jgi:hypothetical protein
MYVATAVVCTLLASFLNAASSVLMRRAAGKPDPRMLFHRNFVAAMIKNRMWLGGLGLQVLAAILQGVALYWASLVLVEPLLTMDLVFLMLILHFRFGVHARLREWGAVVAICGGLSTLLVVANPRGGHLEFSGTNWALTSGLIGTFLIISALYMRRSESPTLRAGLGGVACGLNFALTAGFAKLMLGQLAIGGIGNVFGSWEVYAMAVSGAISLVVAQSTFAAGPLAISQPAIEISDPLVSATIGILLFGDMVSTSTGALALEVIGACTAAAGIILLGGSKRVHSSPV